MEPAVLIAAAVLALVHLGAGLLRFVAYVPRSRWLSFSGGVPVAFVFLDLLPGLARTQARLEAQGRTLLPAHDAYVAAVVGVVAVLAAEHAAKSGRAPRRASFWLSMGTFGLLNALLGHLLASEPRSLLDLALFTLAVALKFFVSDRGLAKDHRQRYARLGRWLLVGAFLFGFWVGWAGLLLQIVVGLVTAFVAGAVVLAVVKEEIPAERNSSWWAFALGAGVYSLLVLLARL